MARLIDADKLMDEINQQRRASKTSFPKQSYVVGDVLNSILNAHTVDAVEVVRCKECMWARLKDHREPTDMPRELICQCFKHHHIPAPWGARMAVDPDDYCSYGERKDNG